MDPGSTDVLSRSESGVFQKLQVFKQDATSPAFAPLTVLLKLCAVAKFDRACVAFRSPIVSSNCD